MLFFKIKSKSLKLEKRINIHCIQGHIGFPCVVQQKYKRILCQLFCLLKPMSWRRELITGKIIGNPWSLLLQKNLSHLSRTKGSSKSFNKDNGRPSSNNSKLDSPSPERLFFFKSETFLFLMKRLHERSMQNSCHV